MCRWQWKIRRQSWSCSRRPAWENILQRLRSTVSTSLPRSYVNRLCVFRSHKISPVRGHTQVKAQAADLKAVGIKAGHAKRLVKLVASSAAVAEAAEGYAKYRAEHLAAHPARSKEPAPAPAEAAKAAPEPKDYSASDDLRRDRKHELLQKVWSKVDADGNGTLDKEEVRLVLVQMGWEAITAETLDKTMAEIDTDGSGDVDFDEFSAWFMKQDTKRQEAMITVHYQATGGEKAETTMAGVPGLLESGAMSPSTLVWIEGMETWTPLSNAHQVLATSGIGQAADVSATLKGVLEAGLSDVGRKHELLQKVWARVDADGSGSLDREEIHVVLVQMGWERYAATLSWYQ